MTIESVTHGTVLSVLRADRPIDDLHQKIQAVQQGEGAAVSLRMWRALDGLAVRLLAGTAPQQAMTEWSHQTAWDLLALESEGRAGGPLVCAPMPEEAGLAALSHLFAGALLNSDPKWQAQADAWDGWFEASSDSVGAQTASNTNLDMGLIERAHSELSGLTETAAQAQLEAVLAQAARQAQGRAARQTAHQARDRETVLAAALLDLARTGGAGA